MDQGPHTVVFDIFASSLFDVIDRHLPEVYCYAEDSQLYLSFNPSSPASQDAAVEAMESCIIDIRRWSEPSCLLLNDDNTEFIITDTTMLL